LAAPHKLELQTRDGFREISHGHWERMTRRETEERFAEEAAEWENDPFPPEAVRAWHARILTGWGSRLSR